MKWSHSAHTAMCRCQLQLVFGQVIAHHGAHDPVRREAYQLKQLQSLAAWQGSVVHTILANHLLKDLQRGRVVSAERLTQAAQALACRQFAFSQAHRYREPDMTKSAAGHDYLALEEHEYGRDVAPHALQEMSTTLARCFENLVSQEAFLRELRDGYGHDAEPRLNFKLNGATITAQPDLLFLRSPHALTVVDWKVTESETSDYSRQLAVYALVATRCDRWPGLDLGSIRLYEANLLKSQVIKHQVDAEAIARAEDFVYQSVVEMEALIGGVKAEEVDFAEYEVADQPGTCTLCPFRPLCIRSLEDAGLTARATFVQGRLF